jgi:hypothetical protein
MKLHMAKDGDTILTLSEKYEMEPERILAANPQIEESELLTRGTKVKIPSGPITMQQAKAPAAQAAPVPQASLAPTWAGMKPESFVSKAELVTDKAAVSGMPNLVYPFADAAAGQTGQAAITHMYGNPYAPVAAESAPAFYKTELPASNYSPLHVKWSGMQEGPAVHPYAPIPTPAVQAGAQAQTFYPGPYGYSTPPMAPTGMLPYGGHYQAPESAFAPYGVYPGPFAAPGMVHKAAGDCGCGGSAARLPYALPQRGAVSAPPEFSRANVTGIAERVEAPIEQAAEATPRGASATKGKARSTAKSKAKRPTPTDKLRAFVRRSKTRLQPTRRLSKPWVND